MIDTQGNPSPEPIRELARIAELRTKNGHDIVVSVKDAGNGPAVDVREYVTRDAYSDSDFQVVGGSTRKPRRQKAPYIGPTRTGWWMSPALAEELADAIAHAVVAAEEMRNDG